MSSSDPGTAAPVLPGYRFLEHLGSGGYSQVYLYEQDMPRRKVAVKVLNETGLTEATRRQFTAEANAMAGLADHPNIVQVFHAAISSDGRPYLVMQYYPQPNLSVRARREHFSVADVLRIGIQIGSAVETAHRNGILHRDIKPHNILTGQFSTPALTDFGIAARKGTDDGGPEGMSVPWSPPEVLYGTSDGDERSDVYSLGATLWHLLAGRSPFEQPGGDNSTLAMMRRIQADPPPRTQRGDVPESLERLLRQTLAKDPAVRPQSALDLVRGLQAVEQEQRLPLTQIVLAADAQPAARTPANSEDEATRVRGARRIEPQPPAAARPSFAAPEVPSAQAPDAAPTRVRGPARIGQDAWAAPAALPARRRHLPAGAPPAAATVRRASRHAAAPADDAGAASPPARTRSARLIGLAGGCILVAAAIGIALALPSQGGGHRHTGTGGSGGGGSSAIGPMAPGTPRVVANRVSGSDVRFRWTYAGPAAGDTFRWRRVSGAGGPATGVTTKPMLLLPVPPGQSVCITVQVVRGIQASTPSTPACLS